MQRIFLTTYSPALTLCVHRLHLWMVPKFVNCGTGLAYLHKCPADLVFSPLSGNCNWPRVPGRCQSLLQPDKEKELNGLAEVMSDLKGLLEDMWTHGYVPPSPDQASSVKKNAQIKYEEGERGAGLQTRTDGLTFTRNPTSHSIISTALRSNALDSNQGLAYLHSHLSDKEKEVFTCGKQVYMWHFS